MSGQSKPVTAHQLAKLLLEQPDVPVASPVYVGCDTPLTPFSSLDLLTPDSDLYGYEEKTFDEVRSSVGDLTAGAILAIKFSFS